MKCLVIIDMQESFSAANDKNLQSRILEKIREYRKEDQFIFVLEMGNMYSLDLKPTLSCIMDAVRGYRRFYHVTKFHNDGSGCIGDSYRYAMQKVEEFELCGVNLDACVIDTAIGLTGLYERAKVNICLSCCGSNTGFTQSLMNCSKDLNFHKSFGPLNISLITG